MPVDTTEKGFEQAIEAHLLAHGYAKGNPQEFDRAQAIFPATVIRFLQTSQPKEWAKLVAVYGAEVEEKVLATILKDIELRGLLEVLRKGVTDRGVKIRLAFFRPASGMNPETLALYQQNVLTVTRQVRYSLQNENSVDLLISLNGLPVATAELKNPFTGQNVDHAIRQYKQDRDPRDPLFAFKKRALVHFAVDPELVFMTTKLAGKGTIFLPFNKGRNGGKGNPDNLKTGWKTAYLWEEVWARDSLMDILARFVHLQVKEEEVDGQKIKKEAMIFPRYHQLDAVRQLVAAARVEGAGENYLIQHSAGSGKSNTIAWLAHRLSSLHDESDQLVFSSVVVITDRKVLDKQLQENIYQFDHVSGVVKCIDADSAQLADALTAGDRIIITTLQKFSFVMDKIKTLPKRTYAIIVDEAHSSQTGESAKNMKRTLVDATLENAEQQEGGQQEDEIEEEIHKTMKSRGRQKNLSFFAFTATPKPKTLELFGRKGLSGKPEPFHLYSMRQAIEEGFILDVLQHYTTYKTYYKLTKAIEDDPELNKRKAVQAVARFVSLHPHNLAQKTEVMVEHFRSFTRHKIGGKAKAMVVTRSRLHAVRYKQAFDKYIREKGYGDMKALVAFSGTVVDGGEEYTEPGMNHFSERELPKKFATDEYQILLVAEKYQTGFDQPLLHTMYVDKKLEGLHAVQTLSRLNRTCAGKEDTFVLDFVNESEEIKEAFKPYYEKTEIEANTDPNLLYTLKNKLDGYQIYWRQEVEDFAKIFFKPVDKQREQDKGLLHKYVDPAAERYLAQPAETREDFRHNLNTYLRLYAFLSQLVDFHDADLEKLYAFGRLLVTLLASPDDEDKVFIDDDVKLAYYRLSKTYEGTTSLHPGETVPMKGITDVGTGRPADDDKVKLSQIVQVLNDKFGTDFTTDDQLLFDQVVGDLVADHQLADQAKNNSMEQFKYAFDPKALDAFIKRMERNEKISSTFMTNEQLRTVAMAWMMRQVYEKCQNDVRNS